MIIGEYHFDRMTGPFLLKSYNHAHYDKEEVKEFGTADKAIQWIRNQLSKPNRKVIIYTKDKYKYKFNTYRKLNKWCKFATIFSND